MNSMSKIKVIPCSGIGKVYGLMAREAILKVSGELLPEETETVCLAHIVTGEDDAKEKVEGFTCVTMDGCPKMCAAKNVDFVGGNVVKEFRSIDAMKEHRGVDAGTATFLTDDGWKIVDELADMVKNEILEIIEGEK